MPEYRYAAYTAQGKLLTGTLAADSEDVCRHIITQRGYYCLSVKPASLISRNISFGGRPRMKLKELSVFCRQFSAMLTSGVGVVKCLDILHAQNRPASSKAIIKNVYDDVQRGQSLSEALRAQDGAFPELLIHMVETGEAGGALDSVMDKVAVHYEKEWRINNKVRNAMMYPLILTILIVVVVNVLMTFVLPTFIQMFTAAGAPLPLPTRILVAISRSLTQYWYVYFVVVSLLVLLAGRLLKTRTGRLKWDTFKVKVPVVGKLVVTVLTGRFARTIASLIQSGVPMLRSLEITGRVMGNRYYERQVAAAAEDIRRGVSLSQALRRSAEFPPMLLSMISVGEESGTLDTVLQKTASVYDEEADNAISRLVGLLEPLMIIVMALIVGFIVISIVMPMYGMLTTIH